MISLVAKAAVPSTLAVDLPIRGSATYFGVALYEENPESSVQANYFAIGQVAANVDFESGTISAIARNFFEVPNIDQEASALSSAEGVAIDGSVSFEMIQIGDANDFGGAAEGSITKLDGSTTKILVSADADFEGTGSEYLDIDAEGATLSGVTSDIDVQAVLVSN